MVGDVLDEVCLGLDDVQQGLAGFGEWLKAMK